MSWQPYRKVFALPGMESVPSNIEINDFGDEWDIAEIEEVLSSNCITVDYGDLHWHRNLIPVYVYMVGYDINRDQVVVPTIHQTLNLGGIFQDMMHCTKVFPLGWNLPRVFDESNRLNFFASIASGVNAPFMTGYDDDPWMYANMDYDEIRDSIIYNFMNACNGVAIESEDSDPISWRVSMIYDDNNEFIPGIGKAALVILGCIDISDDGGVLVGNEIDEDVIIESESACSSQFVPSDKARLFGEVVDFYNPDCKLLPLFASAMQSLRFG